MVRQAHHDRLDLPLVLRVSKDALRSKTFQPNARSDVRGLKVQGKIHRMGTSTFREFSKRRNEHQIGWSRDQLSVKPAARRVGSRNLNNSSLGNTLVAEHVFRCICCVKHVGSRARNPISRVLLGGGLLFSEDRRRSQKSCEPEGYLWARAFA